jgi:hypothetical protein
VLCADRLHPHTVLGVAVVAVVGDAAGGVILDRSWGVGESMPSPTRTGVGLGGGVLVQMRLEVFLPVSVDAITTRIAATTMATIQRVQSMPGLPLPPKAV